MIRGPLFMETTIDACWICRYGYGNHKDYVTIGPAREEGMVCWWAYIPRIDWLEVAVIVIVFQPYRGWGSGWDGDHTLQMATQTTHQMYFYMGIFEKIGLWMNQLRLKLIWTWFDVSSTTIEHRTMIIVYRDLLILYHVVPLYIAWFLWWLLRMLTCPVIDVCRNSPRSLDHDPSRCQAVRSEQRQEVGRRRDWSVAALVSLVPCVFRMSEGWQ